MSGTPGYFVRVTWNLRNGNRYQEDTLGTDKLAATEQLAADMVRPGYIAQVILTEDHMKLIPLHAIDTVDVELVEGEPKFPWHR